MDRKDDLLEEYLRRLEGGEPVEEIVSSLSADEVDLAPLLRLAACAKTISHPQMDAPKAESQRRRVVSARRGQRLHAYRWAWLGGLTALLILMSAFVFSVPARAQVATLHDVQGVVEVASSADAGDWAMAAEGQRVRQGAAIRTRIGSAVTLAFFDGSRASVEPEARLVIRQLSGGWNGALRLRINQTAGETSHQVVKLLGANAFYEVETPAGVARVHGTAFQVDVQAQAGVRYVVSHGVVAVSQGDAAVTLTAGQTTLVYPEGGTGDPAFAFAAQGQLAAIEGDAWTVGGLVIQVAPSLAAGFVLGDTVNVRGRILADGTYMAERVSYAETETPRLYFTGLVETIFSDRWVIGGKTVGVDGETKLDGSLQVGDPAGVSFVVLPDGSWLARAIEALEEGEEATPTPSPTAEQEMPTAVPEGTLPPEPGKTPAVSETPQTIVAILPTLSGDRAGCEQTGWVQPEGRRLAERWGVSYEEIMSLFCRGYGFGEIDLAYDLAQQSGATVESVCAMRDGGMGWGTIKAELRLTPTLEGNTPTPGGKFHENNGNKPTQMPDPHPNNDKPTKVPNPHKK